jgi:hypothetical protein
MRPTLLAVWPAASSFREDLCALLHAPYAELGIRPIIQSAVLSGAKTEIRDVAVGNRGLWAGTNPDNPLHIGYAAQARWYV